MDMNAWDEIVRNDVNDVLKDATHPINDTDRIRPWPPIMVRDFLHAYTFSTRDVSDACSVGDIADYLSESPGSSVAVYDDDGDFLGIAVDDDVMALIKRDGVRALDYPIVEAVQRGRPVCSITDSPVVILQMMRDKGWDRVGIATHDRVIGVLRRGDLLKFAAN